MNCRTPYLLSLADNVRERTLSDKVSSTVLGHVGIMLHNCRPLSQQRMPLQRSAGSIYTLSKLCESQQCYDVRDYKSFTSQQARSHTAARSQISHSLPDRQATGQGTAPSIRHLCCGTSLTNTDASSPHCISALWTSNLHMTRYSGSCYGISVIGWGYKAPCWAPCSP